MEVVSSLGLVILSIPGAPLILWPSIFHALLWTIDDHRATAGSRDMRSLSLTVSCATLKCERCIMCGLLPSIVLTSADTSLSSGYLLLTIE